MLDFVTYFVHISASRCTMFLFWGRWICYAYFEIVDNHMAISLVHLAHCINDFFVWDIIHANKVH